MLFHNAAPRLSQLLFRQCQNVYTNINFEREIFFGEIVFVTKIVFNEKNDKNKFY